MPKALVTGGTGFVGAHVVRHLLARDCQVRCLVRAHSNRSNLSALPVELAVGDLRDRESLRAAVRGCDLVFHVAADYRLWAADPAEMRRVNVDGANQLFEAATEAGVRRIVFTSSVAAVGRPAGGVGNEDLDPAPAQQISPYKKSKFASDRLAREWAARGAPIVIVNPSTPIGSMDIKPTPTGKIIVDFLNRRLPAYVRTGMNFVDAEDVAAGHWLAAEKGRIGQRYILGNQNMTLKAFLDIVARVSGLPAPKIRMPYAIAFLAGAVSTGLSTLTGREPAVPLDGVRMAHEPMYYDASKAVRELGMPQSPIDGAVAKAVEWFRENNYVR